MTDDAFDYPIGTYVPSEIVKKTRIIVDEGCSFVRQAREDYHMTGPIDDHDGPAMLSWRMRDRSARSVPSVINEAMQTAIDYAVERDHAGRSAVAAVALVRLREHYDAHNADELAIDEQTWEAFLKKHAPSLPIERANDLTGRAVFCGGLMRCTNCGTKAKCGCGCGVPYVSEHKWATPLERPAKPATALERAAVAVAAHPEKSIRTIANEIGVSHQTVKRARERLNDVTPNVTPNVTPGRHHGSHKPTALPPQDPDRDLIQDEYHQSSPATDEERWQWSAANLFGDVIAASAYWKREFGDWQNFQPPKELIALMEQANDALKTLKPGSKTK